MPLYDPPHLLKCIRNNLLTKNLEYDCKDNAEEGHRKFAEWDHIIKAYHVDIYSPRLNRMVPHLTDEHVYAHKLNKMCVKLMMQVFSETLSSFIDLLSRSPGKIYKQFTMLVHLLRGVPTVDAKKGYYFMNFFKVYIIDIDIKVITLNKYTLEIHENFF